MELDIFSLMGKYQFTKLHIESSKAIMPSKDLSFSDVPNPVETRSKRELMLCFIGDVEKFVQSFYSRQGGTRKIPIECLMTIFHFRLCPALTKHQSYGHLALHFLRRIRKGESLPARLKYKEHVYEIAKAMLEQGDEYYFKKGLITERRANCDRRKEDRPEPNRRDGSLQSGSPKCNGKKRAAHALSATPL